MSTLPTGRFDVIVVGAGPAGVTAAMALGKAGFCVLLCEAGVYPGAENWSGAVYFTENLERPEAFGTTTVESAPYERRLVERGAYLYNGHSLIGASLRSADVFRSCYTVLRPVYDRFLAEVAREQGVVLACETTVQSLIRHRGRIVGVHTERGPAYADVVFLAEGDASHLVTQEGYERVSERAAAAGAPHFLQGVKEVISLPEGTIEARFGLRPGEGMALEMLLRNASRKGRTARLNMGGFIYTNRDSLSLGFVLPLDNLKHHFEGDHNLLMEWYKELPEIARLIDGGDLASYGAKLIRGGGYREIPQLVDDGLAIGGAASGIGLDFPYPNFTGPATAMGLYFANAVKQIAASNGGPGRRGDPSASPFTADALRKSYLRAVQSSHYYRNVEYLKDWPAYIERTQFFFERQLDLVNNSAFVLSRRDHGAVSRWWQWNRLLRRAMPLNKLGEVVADSRSLAATVGVGGLARTAITPVNLLHFVRNTVGALWPLPSDARVGAAHPDGAVEGAGVVEATSHDGARLRAVFRVLGGAEGAGRPPLLLRWYWRRYGSALASAFSEVYTNDDAEIGAKLRAAARHIGGRVSIWDLLVALGCDLALVLTQIVQAGMEWAQHSLLGYDWTYFRDQPASKLLQDNRERIRLDDSHVAVRTPYDTKLASISYQEGHHSHIKVLWPEKLSERASLSGSTLWSVCPAKVYEVRPRRTGQPGVVVNFENCIKCESCWRATGDVHWSRATKQRLIYQVYTPAQAQLHDYLVSRPEPRPRLGVARDFWASTLATSGSCDPDADVIGAISVMRAKLDQALSGLEAYSDDLARSPLALEKGRRDHLVGLLDAAIGAWEVAAEQWAGNALSAIREAAGEDVAATWDEADVELRRAREYAAAGRVLWAEVVAQQVRDHHVAGLCRYLERAASGADVAVSDVDQPAVVAWRHSRAWRTLEARPALFAADREAIRSRCQELFDSQALRALEAGHPLTAEQAGWLREQTAAAVGERVDGAYTWRDVLLEELAGCDPSLAYLVAGHLLACDFLGQHAASDVKSATRWVAPIAWGMRSAHVSDAGTVLVDAKADYIGCALADAFLVFASDTAYLVPREAHGVRVDDVGAVGLLGASIRRVTIDEAAAEIAVVIDARVETASLEEPAAGDPTAPVIGEALPDLLALVRGAGDYLLRRCRDHASGRVQFPGAFEDEAGRETIGKFGAVKQMLAEMEAQRYLLEAISLVSPGSDGDPWTGAAAAKVLASQAFGPGNGSFSYNAGQLFGGTAFSEDDVIAKFYRDSAPFRFLFGHDDALRVEVGRRRLAALRAGQTLVPVSRGESLCLATAAEHALLSAAAERFTSGRALVHNWVATLEGSPAEIVLHAIGGAVIQALSVKAMLMRSVWRIEAGIPTEAIVEATRLLADRWAAEAPAYVDEGELALRTLAVGDELLQEGELFPSPNVPDAESYADLIAADRPHYSGEWLAAFDVEHRRCVPEIVSNDPALIGYWEGLEQEFRSRYATDRFDGLMYGRYLEKLHIVPDEDLDYMIGRGLFRMPIPRHLGGEEALKAHYYIMCMLIGRFGDGALSLAIMANTSIGTTPALIGLYQDLPRARAELEKVREHPEVLGEIGQGIDRILAMLQRPDPAALTEAYRQVGELVTKRVVTSTVLKYIGGGFLQAFFAAGSSGKRRDLEDFEKNLQKARALLDGIVERIDARLLEYPRRERAHELFLRMISAGYISAFALTEPTAGSDSGGVKTFARLENRRVHRDEDGVLWFWLDEEGQTERRNLLDADRLEFDYDRRRLAYRYQDKAEAAEIDHSEYDYEKDAPGRMRFYMHGGRRVYFADIAQIREDQGGEPTYEFWVLNGAKMWITNGRFSHCMALYARTEPEGVTGFMVDRHAEGMVVGADEDKLGQRGSPTNELSLSNVRVAREMILGFRGRGQVNALETLNTGRAGISVTTHAALQEMLDDVRPYLHGETPPLLDHDRRGPARPLERYWMGRLAEELIGTGAVTYELVGLLDNKKTASVRMESAVGKYYGSEAEHEAIDWMERLRGLEGQTWLHRIEKTRRDARVLNIYEGANEVQRFLLLKDLVQRVLPVWQEQGQEPADTGGLAHADLVGELELAKARLRQSLESATERFGQQVWANVGLQPCFLRLAEVAGLIKVIDAVLYRLEWCARHDVPEPYRQRIDGAGRQFVRRAHARLAVIERRYAASWQYLVDGRYPPETQLGFLSLEDSGAPAEGWGRLPERFVAHSAPPRLSREVEIAVLLKPVPFPAPRPRVAEGSFAEPLYGLSGSDEAALSAALRLKTRDPHRVRVTAYTLAGAPGIDVLRLALTRGADAAVHLEVGSNGVAALQHDASYVARTMTALLEQRPADLVLCGDTAADTGQGLVPAWLAARLGRAYVGGVETVAWSSSGTPGLRVAATSWQGDWLEQRLPLVLAVEAGEQVEATIDLGAWLRAQSQDIEVVDAGSLCTAAETFPVRHVARTFSNGAGEPARVQTPEGAVRVLLDLAGDAGAGAGAGAPPYGDRMLGIGEQPEGEAPSCLYVAAPQTGGAVTGTLRAGLETANGVAAMADLPLDVVVPVDGSDTDAAAIAGAVIGACDPRRVYLVHQPGISGYGVAGHLEWLEELWAMYRAQPGWLLGPTWANELFTRFLASGVPGADSGELWTWYNVDTVANGHGDGRVRVSTGVYGRAANAEASLPLEGGLRVLTLVRAAEVAGDGSYAVPGSSSTEVYLWSPEMQYDPSSDALAQLLQRLGGGELTLADAEFIIDFGYGAGGLDGIDDLAEPLRKLLTEELGLAKVMIGATRKVTQDLELLPMDRQIGQTGVAVNPKLIIALAVSGAPQHIDYIGERAVILSFNIDPDAPMMKLNDQRPKPFVHPITGDVWETVPRFIAAVRQHLNG